MLARLRPFGRPRRDRWLAAHAGRVRRGQSLVEFSLVLPMLLVLLFGLADFGRVFTAGIGVEAAARNAAEAAAQEYLQVVRNKSGGLDTTDYQRIHQVAIETVCREAAVLPNHAVDGGGACTMPLAAVCVHDGNDLAGCGTEADPAVTGCSALNGAPAWNDDNMAYDPLGAVPPLPYIEVRVCYRFTTLFNLTDLTLPFGWNLTLGEAWLERGREFAVANY